MRIIGAALLVLCFQLGACGVSGLGAQTTIAPEVAIRQVIEGQLDALAQDDAVRALSFAAPEIRESFPVPEQFLAMVERGYPMVYRHTSVRFLLVRVGYRMSLQFVRMADREGNVWVVAYRLLRQPGGGWLIGGVSAYPGDPVPDLLPPSTAS